MDKLDKIKSANLRFHRIYTSFFLPVGVVGNIMILVQSIGVSYSDPSLLNILAVVERLLFLALTVIAMRGLSWYRRRGLVALFALQGASFAMALSMTILSQGSELGLSYMASAALSALLIVYYWKRRKLFSKNGISREEMIALIRPSYGSFFDSEQQKKQEEDVVAESLQEEEIGEYDCPRCGRHITDGAVFCPGCGAQTRTVRR